MGRKSIPVLQRLIAKTTIPINKDGTNSKNKCWNWRGPINNAGYGMIKVSAEINMVTVHRVMMIEHCKSINYGDKQFVLHKCGNKLCVNPDHLKLGNINDRLALQRKYKAYNKMFGDPSKMYLTCQHCGKTDYLPHYKRKHSLCNHLAQHKYIAQSISGKHIDENKRFDET